MLLPLLFLACARPAPGLEDTGVDDAGLDDTGGPDDTGTPDDTGPDDTGIPDDTDPSGSVAPPAWWTDGARFSAPPDRGLAFTVDTAWVLEGFSVPLVFRAPDGRYALSATDMRGGDQFVSRSVVYGEDGVTWGEPEVLVGPEDYPTACGDRLEDGAMWPIGVGALRFVAACSTAAEGGSRPSGRSFWAADTTDLDGFDAADAPLWTGHVEGETLSVPSILAEADGDALLYYNGDMLGLTPEGAGIRVAYVDGKTLAVTLVDAAPILPAVNVDPQPVYLDGGGARLYHTSLDGTVGGIAYTPLSADGATAAGAPVFLFQSSGKCDKNSLGECYMDPTFVRTEDGAMYLYFTALTMEKDGFSSSIKRARAVD